MARSFNGSTDYLAIFSGGYTPPTTQFTLSLWVYPTAIANGLTLLKNWGDNTTGVFHWSISLSGGTSIQLFVTQGDGTAVNTAGSTTLSNKIWYHVAATADGTNITVYVNGTATGTPTAYTGLTNNNLTGLGYGAKLNDAQTGLGSLPAFWAGNMAELGIWTIGLRAAEISALAKGVMPYRVRPGSLQHYWPTWGLSSPEPDMSTGVANMPVKSGTAQVNGPPVTLFTPKFRTQIILPAAVTTIVPWPMFNMRAA